MTDAESTIVATAVTFGQIHHDLTALAELYDPLRRLLRTLPPEALMHSEPLRLAAQAVDRALQGVPPVCLSETRCAEFLDRLKPLFVDLGVRCLVGHPLTGAGPQ